MSKQHCSMQCNHDWYEVWFFDITVLSWIKLCYQDTKYRQWIVIWKLDEFIIISRFSFKIISINCCTEQWYIQHNFKYRLFEILRVEEYHFTACHLKIDFIQNNNHTHEWCWCYSTYKSIVIHSQSPSSQQQLNIQVTNAIPSCFTILLI